MYIMRPPGVLSLSIVATMLSLFVAACVTATPTARNGKPVPPSKSVSKTHNTIPEGWTDITRRSTDPSITFWMTKNDFSATIVVRQFMADDSTVRFLRQDDRCVPAQISLRMKLERFPDRYRITRMPESVTDKKNLCSYVYEEHGLLRRVTTFWASGALFEAELLQEHSTADFESLSGELTLFVGQFSQR